MTDPILDHAERIAAWTHQAADMLRQANHAVLGGPYPAAPQLYPILADLSDLTRRTQDFTVALSRMIRRTDPAHCYDDRGPAADPVRTLAQADDDLQRLTDALAECARLLSSAHSHIGHLGLTDPQ